ncbi:ribosome small subunit-dependent GTPase A [Streptomyces fulvorobeus]|uniref:Small ribosomal subunit biogenesis GTPase RsgA n=1 Tax=Streptomyces fulvorobeus TaxID=284028 RepID=A0A7Y9HFL5_9ACTN|nr:ribosome small subunit-dependent GTPase A [Streptomyces fulvorobeus]NYE43640.1 ribosome biogenesis GTPase [Streptomyces fulvorobeus]
MSFSSFSSLSGLPVPTSSHALSPYGWDEEWAAAFAPYAERGLLPGRVVRVDRGQCDLVTPDGPMRADTAFVVGRDPMRVVCTGDWVAVDPGGDPRFVRTLLPRRTAFVRSTSSQRSEGQVLATNIDHIVICVSLAVELDLGRLERFLALALSSSSGDALLGDGDGDGDGQETGGPEPRPIVLLTKADLVPDGATQAHLVQDVEGIAPGVRVLPVSSATGEGIDVFRALVSGGTSVLLGISGAGKSTLANTLLGEDVMHVNAARDVDGKGRHTTTTRNLLVLPEGGVLIDTPGLRGVGLWDAEAGVGQVFAEIEDLARKCRFHDCAHEAEPGCAVLGAVEEGALPERRLGSYRKLLRENHRIAAKTDARLRSETLREWKRRGAEGRAAVDVKRGRLR